MNEKAKKVLSYVACAIGGACLGIALLGGLSYCSTSSAREKTDTINTIDRVKHNELITTDEGGYTGYQFDVSSRFDDFTIDNGMFYYDLYSVDTSTYTLTPYLTHNYIHLNRGFNSLVSVINERYEWASNLSTNNVLFFACWFKFSFSTSSSVEMNTPGVYFSFVLPRVSTSGVAPMTFIYTNILTTDSLVRLDFDGSLGGANPTLYMLNGGKTPYFVWNGNSEPPENPTFQDIVSYYKDLGYQDGHTTGYSQGYDDAYAEKDTGIAFTSCGVFPNAQVTLATDETIGNFKYMYLCHYITKPGYDEHTIYIMWTTNANTGQYLGEVIDRNDSDSYDPAVTLGSFTQQATSSVTITATEDMEFGLWVGYITTFHNRGEITNSILWFQGGTAESDMQIYQNGYDEGYQNGNQQGQETGYENGYTQGKQAGDAEGYERGYNDGFEQTNTQNVFSLFTSAFGAVSSFFDLKIFGFLPLYWFFLAPLFIALISLLMRMVRH